MRSIILAIDAGSSSIRCTAYEYHGAVDSRPLRTAGLCPIVSGDLDVINNIDIDRMPEEDDNIDSTPWEPSSDTPLVTAMDGMKHAIQLEAIVPNTGHIRIHEVLKAIDDCVDRVLHTIRKCLPELSYRIVAVGFSTFVMNFVAVDIDGDPVGDEATCSYACNREDVVRECQSLRE